MTRKKRIADCVVCGRPTFTVHHLIFGTSNRRLSDNDLKVIPLCDNCHTLSSKRLHDNPVAEQLSKMLGQALWEKEYIIEYKTDADEARNEFIRRYGQNFLGGEL